MAHEGDGSCITTGDIFHRDGKNNASRGRKKGFLERETMSFGAENYE